MALVISFLSVTLYFQRRDLATTLRYVIWNPVTKTNIKGKVANAPEVHDKVAVRSVLSEIEATACPVTSL